MAPMASALPHGGYQHPPQPGGHRQYNQQPPAPFLQHMPQNPNPKCLNTTRRTITQVITAHPLCKDGAIQAITQSHSSWNIHSLLVKGIFNTKREANLEDHRHAIWIGNLPPQTELMSLVHHVCELAPGLQSLFLISKSNCAFANFKEDKTSTEAQKAIHESKFQSVRLVCRLRKNSTEAAAPENQIVIAAGTSNPTSPVLAGDLHEEFKSPQVEKPDPLEAIEAHVDKKDAATYAHRDRFFVLKSLTREDMEHSVKTSVWATQSHNEALLNNAFKSTDNVYLIFSANKSGEYFGFARMTSEINQDPDAAIQFAPQNQSANESELPQPVSIEAKGNIPKGHIIDDSARGTMLWEIEGNETEGEAEDEGENMGNKNAEDAEEDLQTWGKPFNLQWLSIVPLPFYRTRGLRNPWNSNREVKIARDGTELEPSVGRRLIGLMNHNSNAGQSRSLNDPRNIPAFFGSGGQQ
ncbi:hypothetical protein IF1G_05603 [Cordyceps javanica]|uniref:YTH domain-containing protein n=1 Tax=Cordyceps javanica TaxID=43265 RepID=A0A545V232_9HYPO|nr:hypothetical protein IF1G_05603 [Cordyceps javanica]